MTVWRRHDGRSQWGVRLWHVLATIPLALLPLSSLLGCSREKQKNVYQVQGISTKLVFYNSARIDAQVVDQQSGQPVEGAAIVAVWRSVDVFAERWDGIFRMKETRS